ncbi:AfsA-related hotdog domain-containing protein [Streptomyces sp. NPDC002851]
MAQSTSTVAGPGFGLELSSVTGRLTHHRRTAPGAEERFTLAGEMPVGHPLFGDAPGRHDSLVFLEIVRQAGPFLGYRGLGVPAERPCLFSRLALRLADTSVWDAAGVGAEAGAEAGTGAAMAVDLRVAPTKSVHGVPRGFRLSGALELDGALGCTGAAELVCLAPGVARQHRASARLATLAAREAPYPAGPAPRPVAPGEVGRGDAANVVVSEPVPVRGVDGLVSVLVVDPAHPVFFAEATDSVPGLLLVEAVRQSAMLAVGRVVGLDVRRTVLTSLALHIRGFAELDLPVECTAVPQRESGERGATGEIRVVRSSLTMAQAGRVVVEADVVAVEQ